MQELKAKAQVQSQPRSTAPLSFEGRRKICPRPTNFRCCPPNATRPARNTLSCARNSRLSSRESSQGGIGKVRKDLEQQLEGFRQKLEEKNKEIAALKVVPGIGDEARQSGNRLAARTISKAKDEASVAQRGLALSQKALHETRDTLREATEGSR